MELLNSRTSEYLVTNAEEEDEYASGTTESYPNNPVMPTGTKLMVRCFLTGFQPRAEDAQQTQAFVGITSARVDGQQLDWDLQDPGSWPATMFGHITHYTVSYHVLRCTVSVGWAADVYGTADHDLEQEPIDPFRVIVDP